MPGMHFFLSCRFVLVFDGWMDSLICPSQSGGIDLMEGVEDLQL